MMITTIMTTTEFSRFVLDHTISTKDIFFTMNALAGELGELANVVKKDEYYDMNPDYKVTVDTEVASGKRKPRREQFVDEAGDTLFYYVQALNKRGVTIEEVMEYHVNKVNKLSKKVGETYKK